VKSDMRFLIKMSILRLILVILPAQFHDRLQSKSFNIVNSHSPVSA
jgi:hypothetical protein